MADVHLDAFSWTLGQSRHYQRLYWALQFIISLLLLLALPLAAFLAGSLIQYPLARYIAKTHHALNGPAVTLQFAAGALKQVSLDENGSRSAKPILLTECRWLGANTLVAAFRFEDQQAFRVGLGASTLLLLSHDNSELAERQRLAMIYHSGLAA